MNDKNVMSVWLGRRRDIEHFGHVEVLECGAGTISCIECEGTGEWSQYHPEPDLFPEGLDCVVCKGTGRMWVSV